MSNRLPYDWFRDSATSVMARMLLISAVLHVLLIVGVIVWFSRHKAVEPKLINVSLVAAPGPMTPMPGSAGAPPPPPPPENPGPEAAPPKPEPPKPEPPKPEPKPEPPKPEPPKPEPKPDKPKPEPKPEKPPKPSTKEEEKPKKPKPVDLKPVPDPKDEKPKKTDLKPVADPKDEPVQKTPQKTGGKPVPKTKGPTLLGAEPSDNVMPSDVPISMAVGGQTGPPTAMGSWPGLLQRQVYLQWIVPNGIPMNDARYLPQITVTIGRDGRIIDRPQVTKPSPSTALDDSCVQALVNATIPPFPDNFEEPTITLVVQFSPMGRQAMGGGLQPSNPSP